MYTNINIAHLHLVIFFLLATARLQLRCAHGHEGRAYLITKKYMVSLSSQSWVACAGAHTQKR